MKKYELTSETLQYAGHTLHRIKALKDFGVFTAGELGGWIESEENLSQADNAWVYGDAKAYANAKVYGKAEIFGDAMVCDKVEIFDNAKVYGNAHVYRNAKVYGDAHVYRNAKIYNEASVYGNACVHDFAEIYNDVKVFGNADVCGHAKVCNNADYIVFKNFWSSGRYFTWTRSNNKWSVGCFYGTGEELIKKAYADSDTSGREYERVVRYVESILADEKKTSN